MANEVFYRDVQIIGADRDSSLEQLRRLEAYERLIREKKYDEAERFEREHCNGRVSVDLDLTLVISCLISEAVRRKNFDLAYMLVGRFEYRGYSTACVKREEEEALHSAKV